MSVYNIDKENMKNISPLFGGFNETMIWSCLQGYMGKAWASSDMKSAKIIVNDFCFFAGEPNCEIISHRPKEYKSDFIIFIADKPWENLISDIFKGNAKKVKRYALKKEEDIFDKLKLKAFSENIKDNYTLKRIGEKEYNKLMANKWSHDLCGHFKDYEEYEKMGIGYVVLCEEEPVCGASSYSVYDGGIEIEIDTKEEYRRQGLALACGAKLILECLKEGLYPSWDAQNKGSLALAEKLGYSFDKEYAAYEIYPF